MRVMFPLGIRMPNEILSGIRLRALSDKVPIVFLPTHKSHMDYLTLHYMCYTNNLPIPHVVAGANLNMPIIGTILRYISLTYDV